MKHPTTPFNAEVAYSIACICLFCTGHWIGGILCLALAVHVNRQDRLAATTPKAPSDALEAHADAALPSAAEPAPPKPAATAEGLERGLS